MDAEPAGSLENAKPARKAPEPADPKTTSPREPAGSEPDEVDLAVGDDIADDVDAAAGEDGGKGTPRKSRRQLEAEARAALEQRRREEEARRAAAALAAAEAAKEQAKWVPLVDLDESLATLTLGDESAVEAAFAEAVSMAASAPVPPGADKSAADANAPEANDAAAAAAAAAAAEEVVDEEESADVSSFLGEVSSRNSGAADVAWRLLRRIAERWSPTDEGSGAKHADARAPQRQHNQHTRARLRHVPGGFGLRNAPKTATLLRFVRVFGPGPEGGSRVDAGAPCRVHLCLADARRARGARGGRGGEGDDGFSSAPTRGNRRTVSR